MISCLVCSPLPTSLLLSEGQFIDRLVAECTIPNLDETEWSLVAPKRVLKGMCCKRPALPEDSYCEVRLEMLFAKH